MRREREEVDVWMQLLHVYEALCIPIVDESDDGLGLGPLNQFTYIINPILWAYKDENVMMRHGQNRKATDLGFLPFYCVNKSKVHWTVLYACMVTPSLSAGWPDGIS